MAIDDAKLALATPSGGDDASFASVDARETINAKPATAPAKSILLILMTFPSQGWLAS